MYQFNGVGMFRMYVSILRQGLIIGVVMVMLGTFAFADDTLSPSPPSQLTPPTVQTLGTLQRSELAASTTSTDTSMAVALGAVQPKQEGNISYITGGVGDEERASLESSKGQYNLWVMSASKSGEFIGETQLNLLDNKGQSLLSVTAGPLFYAKLPPGRYTIQASAHGLAKTQKIAVDRNKPSSIHLSW